MCGVRGRILAPTKYGEILRRRLPEARSATPKRHAIGRGSVTEKWRNLDSRRSPSGNCVQLYRYWIGGSSGGCGERSEPRFRRNLKAIGRRFCQAFVAVSGGYPGPLVQSRDAGRENGRHLAEAFVWRQARRITAVRHLGIRCQEERRARGRGRERGLPKGESRGRMLLTYRTRIRVVGKLRYVINQERNPIL